MENVESPLHRQLDIRFGKGYIDLISKGWGRMFIFWFLGLITVPILFWLSLHFFVTSRSIPDTLFFLALGLGISAWLWFKSQKLIYAKNRLDFIHNTYSSIPIFHFLPEKSRRFNSIKDFEYATKAVSGHASAYEEGNTDYRHAIIMNTDQQEFRLLEFYTRSESPDVDAMKFVEKLKKVAAFGQHAAHAHHH